MEQLCRLQAPPGVPATLVVKCWPRKLIGDTLLRSWLRFLGSEPSFVQGCLDERGGRGVTWKTDHPAASADRLETYCVWRPGLHVEQWEAYLLRALYCPSIPLDVATSCADAMGTPPKARGQNRLLPTTAVKWTVMHRD